MESKKIAILGSSPISLFEALYQAKLGNEVIVISRDREVGGAWKSILGVDGSEFEIGCHIWDVDKKTYQFIEEFIGETLETLSPTPTIIFKNITFPYDWKHNPLVVKSMKQGYLSSMARKKFIKPQIIPRKYKYPKGGSKQLLDVLKEKVSALNIDLKLDTHIERIEINEGGCVLRVNNELVDYDEIVITSFADIKEFTTNGVNLPLKHHATSFCHFHLLIKGDLSKKLSYARLIQHEFIHRVSNITRYSNNTNHVFCVGVFKDKVEGKTAKEIVEEIRTTLIKQKWIVKEAEIVEFFDNEYLGKYIDEAHFKELENIDKLTVLRSTNFIYCIANNLGRWREVLIN